jgi:cyclic pyranopterin phosphate synthase
MLKPVDDTLAIASVRLTHKSGGKSGELSVSSKHGRAGARAGAGIRAAVLVLSDTVAAGKGRDESGRILAAGLRGHGAAVPVVRVLPDERKLIVRALKELCDGGRIDLVLAAGGTGAGPRDVTTEAAAEVIDRRLHGVENAFLAYGQERFPTAMLARPLAGTRNGAVVVAIPGSPSAARDALNALFPALFHAFPIMRGGGHR